MFAVVGHVEWIQFVRVPRLPVAGEIVTASECWEEVGGGGAVAAAQMSKLSRDTVFFTALGKDVCGERSFEQLKAMGLRLEVAWREEPQRRAVTFIDDQGERTITVLGSRLAAEPEDRLPWELLHQCRGCYFTAGPAQLARRARHLTATTRVRELFGPQSWPDAWVGSHNDAREAVEMKGDLMVLTDGAKGGRFWVSDGPEQHYPACVLPGPAQDAYGCGDSFAGGLAYALGAGYVPHKALELAARCGAAARCGRGPSSGQLSLV